MAERPIRLQLSRRKGFNLQALSMATNGLPAVNVARPSKWGNPFTMRQAMEAGFIAAEPFASLFLVECFREWLASRGPEHKWWCGEKSHRAWRAIHDAIPELAGKNLACWCRVDALYCHADVLLEIANG